MEFVRFGGLSKVDYKTILNSDSFHSPPVRYGIYAFVFPYIEDFLWCWKLHDNKKLSELDSDTNEYNRIFKEHYHRLRRKFTYNGFLWTHCVSTAIKLKISGPITKTWIKVHTDDFKRILQRVKHEDMSILMEGYKGKEQLKNPYKRGLGGFMSKDHLEVFIEKVN